MERRPFLAYKISREVNKCVLFSLLLKARMFFFFSIKSVLLFFQKSLLIKAVKYVSKDMKEIIHHGSSSYCCFLIKKSKYFLSLGEAAMIRNRL